MEQLNGIVRPQTKGRVLQLFIATVRQGEVAVQVAVGGMDFADALKTLNEAVPDGEIVGCAPAVPNMPVFVANREE